MSDRMKWVICANSEEHQFLSRDEEGKMVAHIFISEDGITAFSNNGKRTLMKEFPKETSLVLVENHIKEDLNKLPRAENPITTSSWAKEREEVKRWCDG